MILVWHPEHASFDGAILDAGGRTRATSAAVSGNGQDPRLLFPRSLPVADGHGPVFIDDVVHPDFPYCDRVFRSVD